MSNFVHLHVHTEYSLLDGLSKIPHLIKKAQENNQKAIAITDHGVMYGVVKFYLACQEAGIKPIIGIEAYMSEKNHKEKQVHMGADQYHILLLAKNTQGYKNLMKLTSISYLEGFSYKPRLDFELLKKYSQGIIVTSSCPQGIIPSKLMQGQNDEAKHWAKKFLQVFGADFYIEVQSHPKLTNLKDLNPKLIKLSQELGIPLVATNDVHYVQPDDAEAQDALLAVQMRKTISDTNRLSMLNSPDFYLKSSKEMSSLFAEYPDAIENTVKIADKCNVTIPIGKMIFPDFPLPKGETSESYLRSLAEKGLTERYKKPTREQKDRLNYELDVICGKGFATYFLIVQDFVNWAKGQGIRVGPGRGSAAGSIVSYATRITSIDPLEHKLPFERFLNPERPSPPDIDIDIADERRDEVIRYVAEKYGEDHVAQIITFGTMEARASIRDIGRVLGMPYSEPDKIAKLIPLGFTLEEAMTNVFELQEYYKQENYKKLIDLAKKVEGVSRHASTHAAGVVMADKPLIEYTPIQRESKGGKIITQYDMYSLDLNVSEKAIGLLKMDFLGLRNLSILGRSIELVKINQDVDVDLSAIPLDNQKVYQMLSSGLTTGIFQLESPGMRRVARSLKPNRFSDITAMVALYRPGPMELIDDFIEGKKNPKKIKYPHPDLKSILEETYGIPVYQEQVLQIANLMAGYTLAEADILRRAIGKKKKSIMAKEKKKFIAGAKKKCYTEKIADRIWGFIEKFAGYGFNKAHSASYAMIAYQTAYMKVNYPLEYMTALLTTEANSHSLNKDIKVSQAVEECKRMSIYILPPDINRSGMEFTIESDNKKSSYKTIRFGLSAIKNVGSVAIRDILEIRDKEGNFTSLTDFCAKVDGRKVNKKVLESLIRVGAFDSFGKRAAMLASLETIRAKSNRLQQQISSGQAGLFDSLSKEKNISQKDILPEMDELPKSVLLAAEKDLLGIYLTDHPLADALKIIRSEIKQLIGDLDEVIHQDQTVTLGGVIAGVRQVFTKNSNSEMAFATLEDETGKIDLVIFPKVYENTKSIWTSDKAAIVTGKLDNRDQKLSLVVSKVREVTETSPSQAQTLRIPRGTSKNTLKSIGQVLKDNPGEDYLIIVLPNGDHEKKLRLPYPVNFDTKLKQSIMELIKEGEQSV